MSKGLMSIKLIMVPDHGSIFLPKKKKCEKSLVIKGGLKWDHTGELYTQSAHKKKFSLTSKFKRIVKNYKNNKKIFKNFSTK